MLTCGDCGHFAVRSSCSTHDCRNPNYITWSRTRTFSHQEACPDYRGVDTLEGLLLRLAGALAYLELATRIASGELCGTVDDPRIGTGPPERRKRKAKK